MEQKKLNPWHGIVSFAVIMAIFVPLAKPIQARLGLIGVGITELILLALAIGATLVFKQNPKEVFPIRVPKLREIFGVLLVCAGGFALNAMVSAPVALLFPEEMAGVSDGLNNVVTSEGIGLGILIVSIMPAICEEALHRGFIFHTFREVKKQWIVVLAMAVIFGVFHMNVYRFLPTAVLGGCMTWVMLKTDNILMPSLYHATNNLVPILMGFAVKDVVEATAVTTDGPTADAVTMIMESGWVMKVSTIGSCLMLALIAFPLLLAGTALMKKKGEKVKGKHVAAVFIIAGTLFAIGMAMIIGVSFYIVATQGIVM